MKKTFLFFLFVILSSTSFAAMFNNCTPFTAHNGKKFCMVHMPMNLFSAMAYCHQQGFKLASVSDLCDIDSDPANRFTKIWGVAACKNIAGDDVIQTAAKKWLSSPAGAKSMCAVMDYNSPHDATVVDIGSPESIKTTYGAICDTGEWGCPPKQPDDPATITSQECCEYYKNDNNESIWAWDSVNNTCGCPNGRAWDDEAKKCTFCQYRYTLPDDLNTVFGNGSECRYNLVVASNNIDYSLTPDSTLSCPAGQYCYMETDDACSWRKLATGPIYGHCLNLSEGRDSNTQCLKWQEPKQIITERIVGCPEGSFCHIKWENEEGTQNTSSTSSGILYGVCESGK